MALDAGVAPVFGAHAGIGSALVSALRDGGYYESLLTLGRRTSPAVHLLDEVSIARAVAWAADDGRTGSRGVGQGLHCGRFIFLVSPHLCRAE